eukprot:TRINITY_DN70375_c0_g1_i1.p1 TRINITY_DN70375_c0_g1~~TRINITY_DN70375_c0_g1_i1.p1  ORF type:complete len:671 (+),score=175.68 TRINITY_DN70375_c0_g1_i1:103-2013(+)
MPGLVLVLGRPGVAPAPGHAEAWQKDLHTLCQKLRADISPESALDSAMTKADALERLRHLHAAAAEWTMVYLAGRHAGGEFLALDELLQGRPAGRPLVVVADIPNAASLVLEAHAKQLAGIIIVAACDLGESSDGGFLSIYARNAGSHSPGAVITDEAVQAGVHPMAYVGDTTPCLAALPLPGQMLYHSKLLRRADSMQLQGGGTTMEMCAHPDGTMQLRCPEGVLLHQVASVTAYEHTAVSVCFIGVCGQAVVAQVQSKDCAVSTINYARSFPSVRATDNLKRSVQVPEELSSVQAAVDWLPVCGGTVVLAKGAHSGPVCVDKPAVITAADGLGAMEASIESVGCPCVVFQRGGEAAQVRQLVLHQDASRTGAMRRPLAQPHPDDIPTCAVQHGSPLLHEVSIVNDSGSGVFLDRGAGRVTLNFCEISGCRTHGDPGAAAGVFLQGGVAVLEHTHIKDTDGPGVWVERQARALVCEGTDIHDNTGTGIGLQNHASAVVFDGVRINGNRSGGVCVWDRAWLELRGAELRSNCDFGLNVVDEARATIAGTRFSGTVDGPDIEVQPRAGLEGDTGAALLRDMRMVGAKRMREVLVNVPTPNKLPPKRSRRVVAAARACGAKQRCISADVSSTPGALLR